MSDVDEKGLFTRAELAQILGWSDQYAVHYLKQNKIATVKLESGLNLYSAKTIRELLWRRNGRKVSQQRAPFLIAELIEWFLQQTAAAESDTPTDADFAADDRFQKKLRAILRMPPAVRTAAMKEFWEKADLAKKAAALIK